MQFLIDGYNLLHAMGVLNGKVGPTGLHKARLALLGLLRGVYGDEAQSVTVVFDAANPPRGATEVQDYKGVHVHFATDHAQADDLIELIIQKHSAPKVLTVVSDDHRVQQMARRRKCKDWGCQQYLDWLERHRQERKPKPAPIDTGKPASVSTRDREHWLAEFADLANDPALKELSDPPEWDFTVE